MFAVLFLCPIPSGWWSCGLVYNCVELRAFLMISSNWLGAFLGLVCGLSSQIISGVYSNLEVILVLRQCSLKHYSLILESHWKYTSCTLYNNQFKDLLPLCWETCILLNHIQQQSMSWGMIHFMCCTWCHPFLWTVTFPHHHLLQSASYAAMDYSRSRVTHLDSLIHVLTADRNNFAADWTHHVELE